MYLRLCANINKNSPSHSILYCILLRQEIIERLQHQHMLVILVTNSLTTYMDKVRQAAKCKASMSQFLWIWEIVWIVGLPSYHTVFSSSANPNLDPNEYYPDKRFNHIAQVQERLNFLRFLLKVSVWTLIDFTVILSILLQSYSPYW